MKRFSRFYQELDQSSDISAKVEIVKRYFAGAADKDKMWALGLFTNKRPKRIVNNAKLKKWAIEDTGISKWLFEECYQSVGDLIETISLIIPDRNVNKSHSLTYWIEQILNISHLKENECEAFIRNSWYKLDKSERYIFNKLITGSFRTELSQKVLSKAIAKIVGQDEKSIAYKLSCNWHPQTYSFSQLFIFLKEEDAISKPFPFYLAYSFKEDPKNLGSEQEWFAERKWDGIRTQLIHRNGKLHIWSREMELITPRLPEFNTHFISLHHVIDNNNRRYDH